MIERIYESLRDSPQWNTTLFIITYDEHGGFFDHVAPPSCPSPDGIVANDVEGSGLNFDFTRLGVRVPVIMISPWIAKGAVRHKPNGPFASSQFEHSSIPATLRSLFKLKGDS